MSSLYAAVKSCMHSSCDLIPSHIRTATGEFCYYHGWSYFKHPVRIQQASKVPKEAVLVNRSMTREGTFDPRHIEKIIASPETTAGNQALLASRILNGQAGNWGPRQAPCETTHGWVDDCRNAPLDRFLSVSKWMLPIYGALHLIPAVLFKRKVFLENPWRVLARAGLGTARSSAFLGVFVVIYQSKPLITLQKCQ